MKLLRGCMLFGVALAVAGGAALFLDHLRGTSLPAPTGAFAVGRDERIWDDYAIDPRSPPPGTPRRLMAWIWYPAAAPDAVAADYLPEPWRRAMRATTSPILSLFLQRTLEGVHGHALAKPAAAACPAGGCPVLMLRGGHSALVAEYATLAEDLASHGYVVVGVDAPYRTFVVVDAEGHRTSRAEWNDVERSHGAEAVALATRLVAAWSADLRFVVDELRRIDANDPAGRLTGRLDLARVGALGHSLGGASVLQFCHDDARCRAVIDIDGAPFGSVVDAGLSVPALLLLSDHRGERDAESRRIGGTLETLFSHLDPRTRRLRILDRATHFGFADDIKSPLVIDALCAAGHRIRPREQLAQTRTIVREFFDATL